MGAVTDPRYEVVTELGRGASTVVLHVRDLVHGSERALKLATARGQLRRLRREYFRLCELRHPNIVGAFDFGVTRDGLPFYSMELVSGVHLGVRAGRAEPEELAALALQALEALGVLHARGLVHRDLKPRNLLVVGHGPGAVLRLIDLGLAVRVGSRGRAAGTLPYMAPEVARGDPVDGRADLYSLGAVLYEALLPEESARTLEDVARRLREAPQSPARLNPLIPTSLSEFVVRLLEPDPAARFGDAEEAAASLARATGLELRSGPPRAAAERLVQAGAASHRLGVTGRLRRSAQLVRRERRSSAWLFEASVGIGKTPLLRELVMLFNLAGLRVLQWTVTGEPHSPVPLMLQAARALNPEVDGDPELVWPVDLGGGTYDASRVDRLGNRLAEALAVLPTAVVFDDLHRASPLALDVIASFARGGAARPLLLVAAAEPGADARELSAALGAHAEVLRLRPLTAAEVARLAAHRLHGLRLPAPALDRIVHDSQGMPSLVERTLARLVVDRTVQRQGRRWTFLGGRYRPARHDDAAAAAHRLADAGGPGRAVLWAAAVLGTDLDVARVAAVSGVAPQEVRAALAELVQLAVLEPAGRAAEPSYKFGSRATLTAAYGLIPSPRRCELHDAAAALLARARVESTPSVDEIDHVLRGTDDERAVTVALGAGERAAAMHADRLAIDYFLRAHARLRRPDDPRAGRAALRLGKLYERLGELAQASSWYEAAAACGDAALAAAGTLGLGAVSFLRGLMNEAESRANAAVELLRAAPHADPGVLAAAERLQARVAAERGEPARAEALLLEALAGFDASRATGPTLEVLLDLARLAGARGELVQAVRYARRALQRARRVGDAAAAAEASAVLGRGLVRGGRFDTARQVLTQGLRIARASGDRLRQAQLLLQLGNVRLRAGDLDDALARYTSALDLARGLRARAEEVAALRAVGALRGRFGEFRPALIALHAAYDLAAGIGDLHGACRAGVELGHVYARVGHHAAARTFIGRVLGAGAPLRDPVIEAEGRSIAAYLDLLNGEPAPAHALVPFVLERLAGVEDPGRRALSLLYAGRVSLRLGWVHTARRVSERLNLELDVAGRLDLLADARALEGQVALAIGERDTAAARLALAASLAAQAHLMPLEIEARTWLGRLQAGTEEGARELTRAMEVMRDVARSLPADLVDAYLGRADALDLQGAFAREHERTLGAAVAG